MHMPNSIMIALAEIDWGERLRDIDSAQIEALKASFEEVGLRTPITVRKSAVRGRPRYILTAGGHRLAAATQLKWQFIPAFVRDDSEIDAQLWEIDENLARAELSPADRAMFTFRRKELYLQKYPETGHGGSRKSSGQVGHLIDRRQRRSFVAATAELIGKPERTIRRDAERGEKICEAALRILRGSRFDSGATLDRLKKLPSDVAQIAYVEGLIADDKRKSADVKEARAHQQKIRHAVRLTTMAMMAEKGRETAPGKIERLYPIIYADPPWKFGVYSEETGREKSAENHYPTMDTTAICGLLAQIGSPFTDDGILFLWATNPMLPDAFRVMEAWGFTYVHHWIWDKEVAGTGYWGRDRHELLLIGKRGQPPAPLPGTQPETVHRERKGKHSAKPAFFAEQIERLFPGVPKLELFCRSPRPGWDAWGYEAREAAE